MKWISTKEKEVNMNEIHFLADTDCVYLRGTLDQPFLIQLLGESKPVSMINTTYWMPLPKPPIEGDENAN